MVALKQFYGYAHLYKYPLLLNDHNSIVSELNRLLKGCFR